MTLQSLLAAARRLGTAALPFWFALWTIADCSDRLGEFFASDTRIYYRAAQTWLAGGDPWNAAVGPFHFAGLPPTLQIFVPFTILPEDVAVGVGFLIGVVSAVWVIRALRLAWWWLLFPPLMQGVIVANPHIWLLALVLTAHPIADTLASLLKIYALVLVVGHYRWRSVILTVVALVGSVALAPNLWMTYLNEFGASQARLAYESAGGFSAARVPILLIPMAVIVFGLAILDRKEASWLAVPALWPASELFTQTFALPVLAARCYVWFAALLAIPMRGFVPVAIALFVVVRLWSMRGQPVTPDIPLPRIRLRRPSVVRTA